MSVNDLYRNDFWQMDDAVDVGGTDWADDSAYRESLTPFQNATLNGQTGKVTDLWSKQYKVIARANSIIAHGKQAIQKGASESVINPLIAEARFHRACAYIKLASKFGDVPLVNDEIDIDTGMSMGRTPLAEVKQFVYEELDLAAEALPVNLSGVRRATKGAALGMKARFALYMKDYELVISATQSVMDMGIYNLEPNYEDLFYSASKISDEFLFVIPRSVEFNVTVNVRGRLPRNHGGWDTPTPTWDLFAAYLCDDGLPIDESPRFDPHDPFKNRDPRLAKTIVPFGENFLGIEYNPHPEAIEVMNYNTGKMIKNNDTRSVAQYASYNGLVWKKGMDESCLENANNIEPNIIVLRYADILLMNAEAKIELDRIDQSVLDHINAVRARAYHGANKNFPEVKMASQQKLRTILRMERRMEFVNEGLRYMDLMRWRLMDKVNSKKVYMMLYPSALLIEEVVKKGDWFWPFAPEIDEDGLVDFSKMEAAGKIVSLAEKEWDERQYLWPIPATEILINKNMKQNPGY